MMYTLIRHAIFPGYFAAVDVGVMERGVLSFALSLSLQLLLNIHENIEHIFTQNAAEVSVVILLRNQRAYKLTTSCI
jgi:hypothetical protein